MSVCVGNSTSSVVQNYCNPKKKDISFGFCLGPIIAPPAINREIQDQMIKDPNGGLLEPIFKAIDKLKVPYKKLDIIFKSTAYTGCLGFILSAPILLYSAIKKGPAKALISLKNTLIANTGAGALVGGVGSTLFVQNKNNDELDKIDKTLELNSLKKISRNTLLGGAVGVLGTCILYAKNAIKNKTLNAPNIYKSAKILTITGATLGLLSTIFFIRSTTKTENKQKDGELIKFIKENPNVEIA